MSWNDGVSKQLNDYFESLSKFGDLAIEAIKEQVDIEITKVLDEMERGTPQGRLWDLSALLKTQESKHGISGTAIS